MHLCQQHGGKQPHAIGRNIHRKPRHGAQQRTAQVGRVKQQAVALRLGRLRHARDEMHRIAQARGHAFELAAVRGHEAFEHVHRFAVAALPDQPARAFRQIQPTQKKQQRKQHFRGKEPAPDSGLGHKMQQRQDSSAATMSPTDWQAMVATIMRLRFSCGMHSAT
jgi:hypothetical protein